MRSLRRALASTVGGLPGQFWWLWSGTLVNRAGAFVLPFLAIYLTSSLDYSTAFAGLVLGAVGLGAAVASLVAGVLADRWGRRPVLLWSQLLCALTLAVMAFWTAPAAVLALAVLLGLSSNAARPAFSAMVADVVPQADRVRAFSLNYWAINLGFATAAIVGGLLASTGYRTLFLGDAVTTLAFAVLIFLKVPESHPALRPGGDSSPGSAGSLRDVLRDRVFITFMLLTFAFALVFMQHMSTLPVQMADDGLRPSQYGVVISLNAVLIVLATVPLTRWVERFPGARVLSVAALFVGVGFASTAWASTMTAYALTVIIWTIGELISSSIGPAVVADLSPASMRGRYQGAFTLTFSGAALIAPIAGGWVYDHLGQTVLWVGCGLVSVAAAVGHLLAGPVRARRLSELRAAEHRPSPAVPAPSPVTVEEADEAVRSAPA
jgi:MFS family permease